MALENVTGRIWNIWPDTADAGACILTNPGMPDIKVGFRSPDVGKTNRRKTERPHIRRGISRLKLYADSTADSSDTAERKTVRTTVKSLSGCGVLIFRLMFCREPLDIDGGEPVMTGFYSITISKLSFDGTRDDKTLTDVSRDMGEASRLFSLLVRNTVTPETVCYIMDDLLGVEM